MSFWKIVFKNLRHHRFSNSLAAFSIATGIALLVAVYSFKEQSQNTFSQAGIGVDAILAPKGSPLQIVLNAIYHLEDPDVTRSEAWSAAIDTPWSQRVRPQFRDRLRILTRAYRRAV